MPGAHSTFLHVERADIFPGVPIISPSPSLAKAYIVVKDGTKLSTSEIAKFCREKLASYKVPRVFEFRDELPKTLVGKVLRRALREEEEKKLAAEIEADKAAENKSE